MAITRGATFNFTTDYPTKPPAEPRALKLVQRPNGEVALEDVSKGLVLLIINNDATISLIGGLGWAYPTDKLTIRGA